MDNEDTKKSKRKRYAEFLTDDETTYYHVSRCTQNKWKKQIQLGIIQNNA